MLSGGGAVPGSYLTPLPPPPHTLPLHLPHVRSQPTCHVPSLIFACLFVSHQAKWVADAVSHSLYHGMLMVKCVPFLPGEPNSRWGAVLWWFFGVIFGFDYFGGVPFLPG